MFILGISGILNHTQFTHQAFISANGELTSVPTFLQSSALLDRATEKVNSDEMKLQNLSYSAHTHTHTQSEYDTTPELSVYSPIGCWWLVVLVTPIVPKTIPSLSKQNTG